MSALSQRFGVAGVLLGALLCGGACDTGPEAVPPNTVTTPPPTRPPDAGPPPPHAGGERDRPVAPPSSPAYNPPPLPEERAVDLEISPARAVYEDAQRALQRGEREHAIDLLEQAVAIDHEHHLAWGALFDLVRDGDDPDAAADACAGLLATAALSGHAAAARNLECAVAHLNAQRLEQAEVYAREAVALAGEQLQPLVTLSAVLLEQGEAEAVIELLDDQVRTIGGQYEASALNNLGTALLRTGQYREATDAYRRALNIDPMRLDALIGLHDALLALGSTEEAEEALARARDVAPDHPAVLSRTNGDGAP